MISAQRILELTDWLTVGDLLARLALDVACAFIVVRLIYFRRYKNREYAFTYYCFNVITFCLCYLLGRVSLQVGLALALFGVFGILRYRTEQIRIRDLTYLFILIGLGVLNGVANQSISSALLVVINAVIVGMIGLLERAGATATERSTPMLYDQLTLLRPANEAQLLADLSTRTGVAVSRVEIGHIDLLRDAAEITVYFR